MDEDAKKTTSIDLIIVPKIQLTKEQMLVSMERAVQNVKKLVVWKDPNSPKKEE